MAQQFKVNVLGLRGGKATPKPLPASDIYLDAFPSGLVKISPDTLLGTTGTVASRIDYTGENGEPMSAYVAETVTALVALANA